MRVNLRLHPRRDADLIAHLLRIRPGVLSDEVRRLLRIGIGRHAPIPALPRGQAGSIPAPQSKQETAPMDLEAAILAEGWE